QDFYTVRLAPGADGRPTAIPRALSDNVADEHAPAGFLYLGSDLPWPEEHDQALGRLPDEWIEQHGAGERVRSSYSDYVTHPLELYAVDPAVRFGAKLEVERALRDVLGYRVYRDLERGWRITAPNLEQTGLLEIEYLSLDEVCEAEDVWEDKHAALSAATPEE